MTRATPASTYDDDFFAWTQEQAAALRQMPKVAGRSPLDIEHVAEEIEDLGRRDLREVTSFLTRLFEHLMKIDGVPTSIDVPHWRGEARNFQASAVDSFSPGMRRSIDLSAIWRRAGKRAQASVIDDGLRLPSMVDCPYNLDDLLLDDFDIDAALTTLAATRTEPRRDVP